MTTPSSSSCSPPTSSPSGDAELDLAGEVCPFTFVRARLALEAMPLGARLTVLVDHPPAARNVPRSAAEWGQEIAGVTELAPGRWAIAIVKRRP